jgi:hypothetical protein
VPGTLRHPSRWYEHALAIRTAFHHMCPKLARDSEFRKQGSRRGPPGAHEERPFQVRQECDSRRALVTSGFGYARRSLSQRGNLPLSAVHCASLLCRSTGKGKTCLRPRPRLGEGRLELGPQEFSGAVVVVVNL